MTRRHPQPQAPLFSLVNLGCPKNTVDSEGLLAGMALAGFVLVEDPMEADVCIVNTCGFLEDSRREAQSVLDELAAARGSAGRPLIVATGCAVERLGGEPGIDAGILASADVRAGFADYPRLPEICRGLVRARAARGYAGGRALPRTYREWLGRPRMLIGPPWRAYLKLGEGCSNCCAYCAIPLIRGRRTSRPAGDILAEARQLVAGGVREITLIAQDTTAWGLDAMPPPYAAEGGKGPAYPPFAVLLKRLLEELPERGVWVRVLYAHPRHLDEKILDVLASDPRICPYLDLPLQHVNDRMLRLMGRGYERARVDRLLGELRGRWPGLALRSTFIVGHPGETEAVYGELLRFVQSGAIDHLGVFSWSPEPGTRSVALKERRVPHEVAEERRRELMAAQKTVSRRLLRARVGRDTEFLAEERRGDVWYGRTPWQAPDGIDGLTRLAAESAGRVKAGNLVPVRITGAATYDLQAERRR